MSLQQASSPRRRTLSGEPIAGALPSYWGVAACATGIELGTQVRPPRPPYVERIAFVVKRGEGDASAAWIGYRRPLRARNSRSKSLDASGGGEGPRPRQTPPPRNAIGLSSSVDTRVEPCDGRAKPVAFRPP